MMNIKIPVDHTKIERVGSSEFVKRYRKAVYLKKYWQANNYNQDCYFSTTECFEKILSMTKADEVKNTAITCPLCKGQGERLAKTIDVKKPMKVISTSGTDVIYRVKICLCCLSVWQTKEDFRDFAIMRNPQRDLFEKKVA